MKKIKVFKTKSNKEGFSLVGVLGAAFIALLVLTALLSMVSQIFALGKVSQNKFVAVNLAKEGIELVRNVRDSNWMHYPLVNNGVSEQVMYWRGESELTETQCSPGTPTAACLRLRSLCDTEVGKMPYIVDALDNDLFLKRVNNLTETKLQQLPYNSATVFTHKAGVGTPSIFSRSITLSTETNSDITYMPGGNCGVPIDFSATGQLKPQGIIVTSRVTWREPGTLVDKEVVLTARLYDWLTKRP